MPRSVLGAVLVVSVFVGFSSRALAATAADFLSATLPKTGAEPNNLPYRYLVPAGYTANKEYPLIVFLHGSGERGSDNAAQLNNNANGALQLVSAANQSASPCFMIAPQASVSEGWNANTLGQVMRAIQVLETNYSIDLNRIYVTGLSMGGGGRGISSPAIRCSLRLRSRCRVGARARTRRSLLCPSGLFTRPTTRRSE